jgi:hypothetical protein
MQYLDQNLRLEKTRTRGLKDRRWAVGRVRSNGIGNAECYKERRMREDGRGMTEAGEIEVKKMREEG